MSVLVSAVESAILQHNLVTPGETVLVGVSGGVDSVSLLHVLHALSSKWPLSMVAAHFNHKLRGASSDGDESFVRDLAAKLGVPCHAGAGNVRSLAARRGISIEMAAREARHRFYARVASVVGAKRLALAHHADDQVELFFLRALRGAGLQGLGGMRWSGPSPRTPQLQIIRPFLGVSRRDIERFAQERGLKFRHDASNDHLDHERNRVRSELLPFLRDKFTPAVDTSVLRLMEIARDESALVEQQTASALRTNAGPFEELPPAIQRRWLLHECWTAGVETSFEMIEALRRKERWNLDPDRIIWRDDRGRLQVGQVPQRQFSEEEAVVHLAATAREHRFAGVKLVWQITPWSGDSVALRRRVPGLEHFDADRVGCKIRLRHWRPGDRFQPIGAPTSVKVQDLLTNLKVPAGKRVQLILAEAQSGEIFWIEGLRISEQFKISAATNRCLEWRWSRADLFRLTRIKK